MNLAQVKLSNVIDVIWEVKNLQSSVACCPALFQRQLLFFVDSMFRALPNLEVDHGACR